jgi:hypothetical protein
LYEVVLRLPDREELRVTDHDPSLAGYVTIDGRKCEIVAEEDSPDAKVARRYIVRPMSAAGSKAVSPPAVE